MKVREYKWRKVRMSEGKRVQVEEVSTSGGKRVPMKGREYK